jgi:hypothetical protein
MAYLNFVMRHTAQDVSDAFDQSVGGGWFQLVIVHRAVKIKYK